MSDNPFNPQARAQVRQHAQQAGAQAVPHQAVDYLKQVYALLSASLVVAVAAGFVGMQSEFAREHHLMLLIAQFVVLFISFKVRTTPILFLFTGLSGFTLGPVIAMYANAGASSVVGQALFLTATAFTGLTFYALTTKRDLSMMKGMLFAGLIVLIVGGLLNFFFQSNALFFALSVGGSVIFSGFILWETQELRNNPWAIPPASAALSMYLNVLNLFLYLLRLLSILSGDD